MNESIDGHRNFQGLEGLTTSAEDDGPVRIGSSIGRRVRRKPIGFDRNAALMTTHVYVSVVTVAGIMDDHEGERMCIGLQRAFEVHTQMPEVKQAFMDALFLCMAFNGTSVLVPTERVTFGFNDGTMTHTFSAVRLYQILGEDVRRFARCFADDILVLTRALFDIDDVTNEAVQELAGIGRIIAYKRGVSLMPWLFPDCLDAATNLTMQERDLYTKSKQAVIGNSANVVDRRVTTAKIQSADGHVSGLGLVDSPTVYRD